MKKFDWAGWVQFTILLLVPIVGYLWNSSIQTARIEQRLENIERTTQSHDALTERRVERLEDKIYSH